MDVFLIPVGDAQYEPYCEHVEAIAAAEAAPPPTGPLRRLWGRFQQMLKAAEQAQQRHDVGQPVTWTDRIMRWVVERIWEQRLLWNLRKQETATLHYPSDLDAERAQVILREQLIYDADRHRRWLIIDTILTLITGPLFFFVPGPNLVAYYFAFRAIGHYLSRKGAQHGLACVQWTAVASEPLVDLRSAIALDDPERAERVNHVASRLRLEHLPLFVERVALRGA